MKRQNSLFWTLLLLLSPFLGMAQNPVVDSLTKIISADKKDTSQVNALNAIFKYVRDSTELASSYSLQARDLAQKLNFKKGLAYALKNLGLVQYDQSHY